MRLLQFRSLIAKPRLITWARAVRSSRPLWRCQRLATSSCLSVAPQNEWNKTIGDGPAHCAHCAHPDKCRWGGPTRRNVWITNSGEEEARVLIWSFPHSVLLHIWILWMRHLKYWPTRQEMSPSVRSPWTNRKDYCYQQGQSMNWQNIVVAFVLWFSWSLEIEGHYFPYTYYCANAINGEKDNILLKIGIIWYSNF